MLKFLFAVGIGAVLGRILVPIIVVTWLITGVMHARPYAIGAAVLLAGLVLAARRSRDA